MNVMINSKYILGLLLSPIFFSCKKEEVATPVFDVVTNKVEYNAGDSVVFNFTGEPDLITFYSGEKGKEYQFKDRMNMEGAVVNLEFSSRVLFGSQENNLSLVASTDFNGTYDSTNIYNATWVPITDRFTLASAAAGANSPAPGTPSGKKDITDLVVPGKPLYIAFKYVGEKPPAATPTQRTWRFVSFSLTSTFPDGSLYSLLTLTPTNFVPVDVINKVNIWTYSVQGTTPQYELAPKSTLLPTEDWLITNPVYPTRVSPDAGVAIKDYSKRLGSYTYYFKEPGEYKVTFVAANTNAKDVVAVTRELTIKVNP